MQNKTLHIVRGVPGSGKTTYCKKELHITPYEADDFFMVGGKYEFKPEQLAQAHKYCQTNVEWAMKSDTQYIAVANTFTRAWEIKPYLDLAKVYGYEVVIHTCTGNYQNVHGVPEEVINRMKERFETI